MYEEEDYEYEEGEEEVEAPIKQPTNLPVSQVEEEEEDTLGGKALNAFSKLFFVLTIIGTVLTGVMVFLPIFLAIVGILSTILWLLAVIIVSIFTIGIIWTSEDFKSFNSGWMAFNTSMFNSTNKVTEFALSVIPSILVSGAIIIALSWLFTILGSCFDKIRRKKYKGRIIGLSIISVIYIAFLILNIVIHNKAS